MRMSVLERWTSLMVLLGGLMALLSGCGAGSGTEANGGQTLKGTAASTGGPGGGGSGGGAGSHFVYVLNSGSSNISGFKVNTITGVLTAVSTTPTAHGAAAGVAATVGGQAILIVGEGATTNNVQSFLVNVDGTLTLANTRTANTAAAINAIDAVPINASQTFVYLAGDSATNNVTPFAVASSGVLTAGTAVTAGGGGGVVPNGATHVVSTNSFLDVGVGSNTNGINIFQVNTGTGALTANGTFNPSGTSSPTSLTAVGTQLFATTFDAANNVIPLSQDGTTGVITAGNKATMPGTNIGMGIAPTGSLAGTSGGNTVVAVTNEGTTNNVVPYEFVGGNLVAGAPVSAGGAGNVPVPFGLSFGAGFVEVASSGNANNVTVFNTAGGAFVQTDAKTAGNAPAAAVEVKL